MAEQDAEFLKILIRQIGENAEVDPVLGKTLSVLPKSELFEPVRNLLHRGPRCEFIAIRVLGLLRQQVIIAH
jgi:hypothetical protein